MNKIHKKHILTVTKKIKTPTCKLKNKWLKKKTLSKSQDYGNTESHLEYFKY